MNAVVTGGCGVRGSRREPHGLCTCLRVAPRTEQQKVWAKEDPEDRRRRRVARASIVRRCLRLPFAAGVYALCGARPARCLKGIYDPVPCRLAVMPGFRCWVQPCPHFGPPSWHSIPRSVHYGISGGGADPSTYRPPVDHGHGRG